MFYRKYSLLFQDIILVGAGGTGSRVVAPLIQTIKQARMQINPCLYIVDGDHFENKNLARQNCIERDMGRNKAVVMAERYGAAMNFPVVAHPHMIKSNGNMIGEIGSSAREQDQRAPLTTRKLIIMCVDSVNARLMIMAQAGPQDVIIDAGNMDTYGQVSIFDRVSVPHLPGDREQVVALKPFSGEYELPFVPAPITPYLEALVNPPKVTGSCADLDQSLAINNLMAAGIINMVQNLAYDNPFYYRTQFYDLIKGHSTERMTPVWFNQVWNETTEYDNNVIAGYSMSHGASYCNKRPDQVSYSDVINKLGTDIAKNVQFINPALLAALGK